MLYALVLLAAVTGTTTVPDLPVQEPITRSAQLLRALDQAQEDFASVQKELGLVGAAPLAGLKPEQAPTRTAARPTKQPRVHKASVETRR